MQVAIAFYDNDFQSTLVAYLWALAYKGLDKRTKGEIVTMFNRHAFSFYVVAQSQLDDIHLDPSYFHIHEEDVFVGEDEVLAEMERQSDTRNGELFIMEVAEDGAFNFTVF